MPLIRELNIIPSGLCNSRRHRQCPASRVSVFHTPGPRSNVLQGVRLHNPDYVKFTPSVSCEPSTSELPGEAAAGKVLAAVAGLHPALCQPRTGQRNWGPAPPNSSTSVPFRISVINTPPASPASTRKKCEDPAALGASLGVGPAPKAVCQSESATPPLAPFLRGTAPPCVYLWALFRHTSAGKNPARSVSGTQSAAVPAAGADSVSHRRSVRQLTSPPRIRAASHRLRRYPRISVGA